MAKVKAPLMSFSAAGKLADSMVFFTWKGLNVVRQYVVPTNPKTGAQNTQRGYVKDANAAIHAAMADLTNPITQADQEAYAGLGSLQPTPRTWFNTMCKIVIDQLVAAKEFVFWSGVIVTPSADTLTITMFDLEASGAAVTDGKLYYGTTKSNLSNSVDCTVAELAAGKAITPLVTGVKYFVQYRPDTPSDYVGSDSGIVYGVAG